MKEKELRKPYVMNLEKDIKNRKNNSLKASKILGFKWLKQYNYPDNQLDKISLLEITKIIEKHKTLYIFIKTLVISYETSYFFMAFLTSKINT